MRLREDYDNPNLLFIGTEFGLYVTLDGGKEYKKFMTGLPSVRVDDILIHPRDRDLIIATHGRSIWIADDISPLEKLKPAPAQDAVLFEPRSPILWKLDRQALRQVTNRDFKGENPEGGTAIHVWAKSDLGAGKIEFMQGTRVASTMDIDIKAGMNRFQWNVRGPAPANAGNGGGRRGGGAANATATDPAAANAPAVNDQPDAQGRGRGGRGPTRVPFVSGRRWWRRRRWWRTRRFRARTAPRTRHLHD